MTTASSFWFRECTVCEQGRLVFMEDTTNDRIYLHCEECEQGFWSPDDVQDPEKSFLTLTEDFEAEPATEERIAALGWGGLPRRAC
jgi:hypothetical protein